MYQATNPQHKFALGPDECLRDYTFIWTERVNVWFRDNIAIKDGYMIYAAFLMDFMILSFLVFFFFFWKSSRLIGALLLFYPVRQTIQNNFLISRPAGFLWYYPGLHSLTIPYFDTNDFYFSGHVGSSTTFASEYFAHGWTKMGWVCTFVMFNEWIMLTSLRTHYIIDLISGFVVARLFHRWGEKLAFFLDVKLFGLPKQKRNTSYYDPCAKCGWNNTHADHYVDLSEASYQQEVYATLSKKNGHLDDTADTLEEDPEEAQ